MIDFVILQTREVYEFHLNAKEYFLIPNSHHHFGTTKIFKFFVSFRNRSKIQFENFKICISC